MGFVQVDTINIVERAHELILASRLDGYRPALLRTLLEERRSVFEHWTHDASIIPVQWFAHWKPRFTRYLQRAKRSKWWQERLGRTPSKVVSAVRQAIASNGPMMSREFELVAKTKDAPPSAWWGWKPEKIALEHLWRSGELSILKRVSFQKVYDLTERVLPHHHALPAPTMDEHIEWSCRTALERLVFATPKEVAAFWAAIDAASASAWLKKAQRQSEVELVTVETADGSPARAMYALPDWRKRISGAQAASTPDRMRFINPFDPIVRDRQRALRLFNFDYRFEAFTPAPKRKYGYYVMPLLDGDQLVGRCDAKHHRDRQTLEIKGVWWERNGRVPAAKADAARRRRARFDEACERLAGFIGAAKIERAGRMTRSRGW